MVAALRSGNEKQKEEATRGFVYLAGNARTRSASGMSSAIRPLVKLLQSGNEAMRANAALVLGNLAVANDENMGKIKGKGAVALLQELGQSGTSAQKRNAAAALANIVQDDQVQPNAKRSRLS
jgi:HEAT repeat protein